MKTCLHPLLTAQHGVVTRQQCLGAGLSPRQIDLLLTSGSLVPVFRGVFVDPVSPRTIDQRAMAATLAGGSGTVVSHRMAVAMHGMRNFVCDLAEISLTQRVHRPGVEAHRVNSAPPSRLIRKVLVTTAARTLLDCAAVVSQPTVGRFMDTWLSTGVVKLVDIDAELISARKHQGIPCLKSLLEARLLTKDEADSPAEMELGELLARHGMQTPELHHIVTLTSGTTFELDWSYPDLMVAFEMDGYGIHLRSMAAFDDDRTRRNELEIAGWTILNFTRRMLRRSPKAVVDQARRMVASRQPMRR